MHHVPTSHSRSIVSSSSARIHCHTPDHAPSQQVIPRLPATMAVQSAASRRLLSTLSSKLHPQLPLSPRESQQLLTLLTSSFRAHLDREHPLAVSEQPKSRPRKLSHNHGQRSPSPTRATSSYASATRHIDSILTNPLFAVEPRRRGSEPAAVDIMRDPMAWFVNEIATGAATLPKAAMCLEMLEQSPSTTVSGPENGTTPAAIMVQWLRSSGLDTSRQFLELSVSSKGHRNRFLDQMISLLAVHGETSTSWRWLIRSNEQRQKETGLDAARVAIFRQQLLAKMVSIEAESNLEKGMVTFLQAFRMTESAGLISAYSVLRPAGAHLVNRITSNTTEPIATELYDAFLNSTQEWLGNWSAAINSMLWLHHPANASTLPGLRFLQDPAGAVTFAKSSRSRRRFLVQLCLELARQSLEQDKHEDAQAAMVFAKEHFADIVLPKAPVVETQVNESYKVRRERENLELLDTLVPA